MGILAATALHLMNEGKRHPFQGKLLQLGKQEIWFKGTSKNRKTA